MSYGLCDRYCVFSFYTSKNSLDVCDGEIFRILPLCNFELKRTGFVPFGSSTEISPESVPTYRILIFEDMFFSAIIPFFYCLKKIYELEIFYELNV